MNALQLELFNDYVDMDIKSIPYYENPSNDNERLLTYQYRYLVLHDNTAYASMWTEGVEIAKKFIRKERGQKGFRLDHDEVMDKAIDAVEYVLRRFKRNSDYYIKDSFTSELYFGVIHALYHQTQSQMILDRAIKYMNDNHCGNLDEALEAVKQMRQKKKLMRETGQGVLFET